MQMKAHHPTGGHCLNYMVISDQLDMVGVRLKALYTQICKADGIEIQLKI